MSTRERRRALQHHVRTMQVGAGVPPLHIQVTSEVSIQLVRGELRKRAHALLTQHYTGVAGNAGRTYAVVTNTGAVLGAVLIGGTASKLQSRSLIGPQVPVRVVKRVFCLDHCCVPESMLLRAAARDTANQLGQTCAVVAYAEPSARDSRTGAPMVGRLYLSSGFHFIGHSGRRRALLDAVGCVRSPRQGKRTLTLATTPTGWCWVDLPPASIWMTIVTPQLLFKNGALHLTTERWCKRQWKRAWACLPAHRRVAARQWLPHKTWFRLRRAGRMPLYPLDPATEVAGPIRRQNALWFGSDLHRNAAPVFPPLLATQLALPIGHEETTANRRFVPLRIRSTAAMAA